jgi:tyrosyl-DNA phosphodiesterase 1
VTSPPLDLRIGFPHGLRVAIHTANLIYSDNHNKSNGVWVQDFPYKSKHDYDTMASSSFEVALVDYVQTLLVHGGE